MPISAPASPPPLRDGDRLTSEEFLRRWEAMPDLKHVELIDGIVYMPSPVGDIHSIYHFLMLQWLGHYELHMPSCQGGVEGTWIMGERDVPSPDIALRILPEYGGRSRHEEGYPAGAPELIVEVAVTSRARDLGVKLELYERIGVGEYVVVDANQSRVLWHESVAGKFQLIEPDSDGILRSRRFPGLWLDAGALWHRDKTRLIAVLNEGLASPEHAEFVSRLAKPKG